MNGSLIISLDFELLWGMIENPNSELYSKTNILNVPTVISRLLELFEKYDVKATFATVGFIMCNDVEDILQWKPNLIPTYNNSSLSPYGKYLDKVKNGNQSLYFAPELVEQLRLCPNVEIGTHTFCHYYCWENGQTVEQFEQDLIAAIKLAQSKNLNLTSIVFPRNNVSDDYIKICAENGIVAYRGNSSSFFGKPKNKLNGIKNRVCRFIDSYLPLAGSLSYSYSDIIQKKDLPINIPASRMLRPYSPKLSMFEPLRIRRIRKEIEYAAKHGELYHLWWHPHNFGANINQNFKMLEKILQCYAVCKKKYGMSSYSMTEFTEMIKKQN